jgi:hypothetical protein
MPIVTAVHIVFDDNNDPGWVARRHIAREIGKGIKQMGIVSEAWVRGSYGDSLRVTSYGTDHPFLA